MLQATINDDFNENRCSITVSERLKWLEQNDDAVQRWLSQRHLERRAYFDSHDTLTAVRSMLGALWNRRRVGLPFEYDNNYYFMLNSGLQEKAVLCRSKTPYTNPEFVIDTNLWNREVSLANFCVSPNERYLAYATSNKGSDWVRWEVYDLARRATQPVDRVMETRGENISWTSEDAGFFYVRYPRSSQYSQPSPQVWLHKVNSSQELDQPISDGWQPWQQISTEIIEGQHLLVIVKTREQNMTFLHLRSKNTGWREPSSTIERAGCNLQFIGFAGDRIFWIERNDNDLSSVRVSSLAEWSKPWETLISGNILSGRLVYNNLAVVFSENGFQKAHVYTTSGELQETIPVPDSGSLSLLGKHGSPTIYVQYRSFCQPATNFSYHLPSKRLQTIHQALPKVDLTNIKTERTFFASHDGTSIPVYITYDGNLTHRKRPVLFYGYGGHGTSVWPSFSLSILVWLLAGGIYVVPSVRGGSELGSQWHKQGQKKGKWNSIFDFVYAAKWLASRPFVDSTRMAAMGSSAGGFLVASAITTAPELFRAAIINAGLTDMLRYEQLARGGAWVNEYGSMSHPEEAANLMRLSPLENIRKSTKYPSVLLYTGLDDDRVHPSHSYKFCEQMLQENRRCVLQTVASSGHAAGLMTTSTKIERHSEQLAFLFQELDLNNQFNAISLPFLNDESSMPAIQP